MTEATKLFSDEFIKLKASEIQSLDYEHISRLPPVTNATVACTDGKYQIAVWKDGIGDSSTRIVVQAYRSRFVFGRMIAVGFVKEATGRTRQLVKEELYDFT